jgi:prepilin-type N-terminal cleavage/methylation domain-containing protein
MRRKGFSLIEVLVASALVAFLLAGTAELLALSLRAQRKAERVFELTARLASRLECLKSLPFESPDLLPGAIGAASEKPSAGEVLTSEWRIESAGPGLKKIDLNIHVEGRPERGIGAALLVSRSLGF